MSREHPLNILVESMGVHVTAHSKICSKPTDTVVVAVCRGLYGSRGSPGARDLPADRHSSRICRSRDHWPGISVV